MPRRPAARTVSRAARTPSRCPATRGRPRSPAHRPFPSMITATCRGRRLLTDGLQQALPRRPRRRRRPGRSSRRSKLQDLLLLLLLELVDLLGAPVGELLERRSRCRRSSSSEIFLSLRSALTFSFASRRTLPDRHARFLGKLADRLRQLLPSLLVERRDGQAGWPLPSLAGVRPRSDFWMACSIFFSAPLVPGLDHQESRASGTETLATWLSGSRRVVVVDAHVLQEQRGVGAARSARRRTPGRAPRGLPASGSPASFLDRLRRIHRLTSVTGRCR